MKIPFTTPIRFIAAFARRSMLLLVAFATANLRAVVWDPLDESGGYAHWDDLYLVVQIDRPKRGEATVASSDINYVYPNGNYWIPSVPSVLAIPSECNGVPITFLANRSLSPLSVTMTDGIGGTGNVLWTRGVHSVIVPESVVNIGSSVFYGAKTLTSVTLPSGLQSIGERAFAECSALASIDIPSTLSDLPTGLFSYCSSLRTVSLHNGLKSIGAYSFRDCSALSSLSIPSSVETIGNCAFQNCRALSSLSIPGTVEMIGEYAFGNCSSLTSISVPSSVKEIGVGAFQGCRSLQTIHFPTNFFGKTDNLGIPSGCIIEFGEPLSLVVSSCFDRTVPNPGVVSLFRGASVVCRAETFEDSDHPGFQYECIGWTGSGSVPASGSETEVSFVLQSESSIAWNWRTNVWIDCVLSGEVSPIAVARWQPLGETLVIPFEIDTANASALFSGDADGVVFDPIAKTISIPADRPRALAVQIGYGTRVFTHMVLTPLSGGDAEWRMEANSEAADGYCFRSGEIDQGETSTVEMRIEGAGTLSFDWKISANRSDRAYFYVDGVAMASITRSTDWANVSTNLANGTHVLRWVFDRHAAAAANADAAFLDNISWRPLLSLTVSSAFGTPSPAAGTVLVPYGDLVSASVAAPAAVNGTRRVCTGWTGSGSIPAEGTSSSVQFVMTKSTTLVWRWRTDHWIDASVDSGGSTSFQPQWAAHGSTVVVPLVPATHLFNVSLSGDTDGVTVSGTSVRIPADKTRTIHIAMSEIKLPLVVASEHGDSLPEAGDHSLSWGTFVRATASDPDPADGFAYHCTGWRGTGSVPSEGVGSVARFTMEKASTLSWVWQTNFWVELSLQGAIAVDVSGSWTPSGRPLVVPYEPLSEYATLAVSGDSDGVAIDPMARTITIPADRPRSVSVTATAMSLSSALDATGLVWTTSGGGIWVPQREISSDGVDAAASGDATGGDNFLETTVLGPGTLSWFWKMNTTGWAGVDATVDDHDVAYLETAGGWTSASTQIAGDGPHSVRFSFWTEEGCSSSDRAYLDRVTWTGSTVPRATQTTPGAVPYAWLDRWPELLADNGNDYERAASSIAANGINSVWECYVAGIDPTDPASVFLVNIAMENGEPRIEWAPDLGNLREYMIEGRTNLFDGAGWENPPIDGHRFFRVRVGLPGDAGATPGDDAFPGWVTVTFDPTGGTVNPTSLGFERPGTLGTLPIPVRGDVPFLGWYSSPTRGVRFLSQTAVPYRDTRLYARWDGISILFDPNGGTGSMEDIAFVSGAERIPIPDCDFSKPDCYFVGWATRPDGAVEFKPGDVPDPSKTGPVLTLYAVWRRWKYSIRNGVATLKGAETDVSGRLVLPSTLDGFPVSHIGGYAFFGCSGLTSVTIPSSVTGIANYAFSGCSGLTSVTIPSSVTGIDSYAFMDCSGLTSMTIPNSVTHIRGSTFRNCSGLASMVVAPNNPVYDSRGNCNAIIETASNTLVAGCKNTTIPDSVTSIGSRAFSGRSGLTSVTIPDSVTSIGDSAFCRCSGLTSITIPDSVTSIGDGAFFGCSGLTSVTIPDSVTSIGEVAFANCSGLTSVTIPDGVTSIGWGAFKECSGLTSLSLPKRFEGNTADLGIPNGCTVIFRE